MYMRRVFASLCILFLFIQSACADTSIFVATDRHAKYETVVLKDEEPAADGQEEAAEESQDSKPPKAPKKTRKMPVYDINGALIWHNNLTDLLNLVLRDQDAVQPDIVLLGGDNVGDGGDTSRDETGYPMGAPYFSMKSVDSQIASAFGNKTRKLYTYGSHDDHETGAYTDVFFTGPVACDGYYVYGISFAQMKYDSDAQALLQDEKGKGYSGKDLADPHGVSAQTASHLFLAWVNSLDDHLPIIVMSHMPLHASRGDNLGAWTWTRALNDAAENHDIFFLWGHNHTVEQNEEGMERERANYLLIPSQPITVQSWELDENGIIAARRTLDDPSSDAEQGTNAGETPQKTELVAETETLQFVYMNAGYITNGVGTLMTFSGADGHWDVLTAKRYSLFDETQAKTYTFDLRNHWD